MSVHEGEGATSGTLPGPVAARALVRALGLKHWRTRRLKLQTELAAEAGVTVRTIQRLESGKPGEISTIRDLARALEVDPSELLQSPPE